MKYWIKGGLIAFVIGVLLLLIMSFMPVRCFGLSQDGTGCSDLKGFDAFSHNISSLGDYFDKVILYFILPLIILGTLIGWILERRKSR